MPCRVGFLSLALAFALAACGTRPLTPNERAFADSVMGPALDPGPVRFVHGAAVAAIPTEIPPQPRETCRERLRPPTTKPVPATFAAMAWRDRVFFGDRFWRDDFLSDWPASLDLRQAMLFAHELTHVWQWQNRAVTGYSAARAGFEHVERGDPYLTDIDPDKPFLAYGYEQQGVIVEEFVCCRALDPEGARTAELHRLVSEVFPAAERTGPVPRDRVTLPWSGAETRGICS